MKQEQQFPQDIAIATSLTKEAMATANMLVSLIEAPEWFGADYQNLAENLLDYLRILQKLWEIPDSLYVEFATVFENPACYHGKSYTSHHAAASSLCGDILRNVWQRADPEGYSPSNGERVFRLHFIAHGLPKAVKRIRNDKSFREIDSDLFTMILKEAYVSAANRRRNEAIVTVRKKTAEKRTNTNTMMLKVLQSNNEAYGWTQSQWAQHLKKGLSTIKETKTWKSLQKSRLIVQTERGGKGHARGGQIPDDDDHHPTI